MEDKIIEHHHVSLEHEMKVNGYYLFERKQKTYSPTIDTTIIEHVRTIDERTFKVTEHFKNGVTTDNRSVETYMTEEEVKQFESDWSSLWEPKKIADDLSNLY